MSHVPDRAALREYLVTHHIAGDVATPRENNLDHYRRLADREPLYLLGLEPVGRWTPPDVLALMVERCGVSPDPRLVEGPDTIDADRTLDRLDAMAVEIAEVARHRGRVLLATGHPDGVFPIHVAVARALRAAGCGIVRAAEGWRHPDAPGYRRHRGHIGYRDDVAVLCDESGQPIHTHSPLPMRAILDEVTEAPDLVVADHGWAGAAGQAGLLTVGFADCNDPALFVGEAEGSIRSCVPLDDNLDPYLYLPIADYLLHRAGLPTAHAA